MAEPNIQSLTVDEMLAWLNNIENHSFSDDRPFIDAIRAILEQHRNIFQRTPSFFELCGYSIEEIQIILEQQEARHVDNIERFLESAEKRAHETASDPAHWCEAFTMSIAAEFTALEKACNDRGTPTYD